MSPFRTSPPWVAGSRRSWALEEEGIVNCTGIGSRSLFGDFDLVPIKGQLAILLPQPEADYIAVAGGSYMFPRTDGMFSEDPRSGENGPPPPRRRSRSGSSKATGPSSRACRSWGLTLEGLRADGSVDPYPAESGAVPSGFPGVIRFSRPSVVSGLQTGLLPPHRSPSFHVSPTPGRQEYRTRPGWRPRSRTEARR